MKVSRINEHLQAYQIAMYNASKHRELENRHDIEKKTLDRIEETRVQRARRLDLVKGTNVDLDC